MAGMLHDVDEHRAVLDVEDSLHPQQARALVDGEEIEPQLQSRRVDADRATDAEGPDGVSVVVVRVIAVLRIVAACAARRARPGDRLAGRRSEPRLHVGGAALPQAAAGVDDARRIDRAVHDDIHRHAGIQGVHVFGEPFERRRVHEVRLGQQHAVRDGDLLDRLEVMLELLLRV